MDLNDEVNKLDKNSEDENKNDKFEKYTHEMHL